MSLYESVFIARQEISAQQADALAETFSNVIAENGARSLREPGGKYATELRNRARRSGEDPQHVWLRAQAGCNGRLRNDGKMRRVRKTNAEKAEDFRDQTSLEQTLNEGSRR